MISWNWCTGFCFSWSRRSSVGIVSRLWAGFDTRHGQGVSAGSIAPLNSRSLAAGVSDLALTNHHHFLQSLRTVGTVPSFPTYTFMAGAGTALLRSWLLLLYVVCIVDKINGAWTSHSYFGRLSSSSCCHVDDYCVASKQRASYLGWQKNVEDARLKPRGVMCPSCCDSRIRISLRRREVLKAVVLIMLWWTFSTADVRTRHWTQCSTTSWPHTLSSWYPC